MARKLRPIGHLDRLSVVDHLDELRSRLIVCAIALGVVFAVCFWQNDHLISLLNHSVPLKSATTAQQRQQVKQRAAALEIAKAASGLASSSTQSAADRANFQLLSEGAHALAVGFPKKALPEKPITIGVAEPFTTTMAIAAYFALLFTLPLLIYEAYAFILPAFNPEERRMAFPVMVMSPILFILGVVFAYFLILPPAVAFLQGFNSSNFQSLLQAKPYYEFEILTMLGIGLTFQLPLGLLALDRLGVLNSDTLIRQWRYAVVIIAIAAAALPGADPVTTLLEMAPLLLLYGLSIVLLRVADRRTAARRLLDLSGSTTDPT
ncbi:MAG: sec-independent protein translocase protein TatC [Solirubrobacteraceae bacterium]|jgi:sec-independent protein translocase protein TatC|nr:sec-independent protein translocase protein TatC [Solirubrobacteraceae bacterium]